MLDVLVALIYDREQRGDFMKTRGIEERRGKQRFAIKREVTFCWMWRHAKKTGSGASKNWSSSGIYIACSNPAPTGTAIYLEVAWPAKLDEVVPLKLRIRGTVIRTNEDRGNKHRGMAVAIDRYEFATRGLGLGYNPREIREIQEAGIKGGLIESAHANHSV
jgi:hypothetical protein